LNELLIEGVDDTVISPSWLWCWGKIAVDEMEEMIPRLSLQIKA